MESQGPFDRVDNGLFRWIWINHSGNLSRRDLQALSCVSKRFNEVTNDSSLRRRRLLPLWKQSECEFSTTMADAFPDAGQRVKDAAFVVHLLFESVGTEEKKLPEYSCVGVSSSLMNFLTADLPLAYFQDGDVWTYGAHAKYKGTWPNSFGFQAGDVISVSVCSDLKRYKALKVFRQDDRANAAVTFYRNGIISHRPFLIHLGPHCFVGYTGFEKEGLGSTFEENSTIESNWKVTSTVLPKDACEMLLQDQLLSENFKDAIAERRKNGACILE